MPGPLPKDPAVRQRRNKATSRAILPAEETPIEAQPRLPKCPSEGGWHSMAKQWWLDVWSSPMSSEFLRGDIPALFRLVSLVDSYWKTGDLQIAKEIRLLEREFGLTPLSRRRLEWQVVQTEEIEDRRAQRRARRAVEGQASDPREVLE